MPLALQYLLCQIPQWMVMFLKPDTVFKNYFGKQLFCLKSISSVLSLWWAAECTPMDAFKYSGDNIIFASGSPFDNVDLG